MVLVSRFRLSALILVGLLVAAGCSTTTGTGPGSNAGANPRIPESASSAVLRSGDNLTVTLQGVPDPSVNTVQIGEQGVITLPYIGNVMAAGVSTGELSQKIRDTYIGRNIYTTVDVSVSVTERYVYVGGEVGHPGRIVWTPDLTASKAIEAAGGFSLYAKQTAVDLVRDKASFALDIKLARKDPGQDPRLMPGDALQVPRSPF